MVVTWHHSYVAPIINPDTEPCHLRAALWSSVKMRRPIGGLTAGGGKQLRDQHSMRSTLYYRTNQVLQSHGVDKAFASTQDKMRCPVNSHARI